MRGIVSDSLHEVLEAGDVHELHRAQRGAAVREMHVGVVESRQQPVTLGIEDARMRSLPAHDLGLSAYRDKAAIQHGERIGLGLLGIHGPNTRVANDELGRRPRIGDPGRRRLRSRGTRRRRCNRGFRNGDGAAKRRASDECRASQTIKQRARPL